jgi:hypothetical protein
MPAREQTKRLVLFFSFILQGGIIAGFSLKAIFAISSAHELKRQDDFYFKME